MVVAGRNYGAGSSRDWAAKVQALLGVRAVIAESFERIHRGNLIGMGVLPLQFAGGRTADELELTGEEELSIDGLEDLRVGSNPVRLTVRRPGGATAELELVLRLDTRNEIAYLHHGGTLPYVVRRMLVTSPA